MMDFRFTQDQQDLIDAAKAVFDGENTVERMRAMAAGKPTDSLWPQLAELGLLGIMAAEDSGGLAQSLAVMAAIAEAAGYAGLPEPYCETAGIAVPLLQTAGAPELADLLSGAKRFCIASLGTPYAQNVDRCDGFIRTRKDGIDVLNRQGVVVHKPKSIDPLRDLFKIINKGNVIARNALADFHGAVLTAAQLVGLSQRMLDMSVDYTKAREQFGKPIGSFQAIKHHLASLHTQIEFTRPVVHLAAIKGGHAVHTAKVAAIDTAMLAAETAIQIHGGMGYTFEVDLHFFMKRAWALCGEWGDRNYHMKCLEALVLDGDAPLGPGTTI